MSYSKSDLRGGRDTASRDKCQQIHDAGTENLAALTDYLITTALLTDLQQKIAAYNAAIQKPRQAKTNTKTATSQLEQVFAAADQVLGARLDKLVVQFEDANPTFFTNYQNARLIVDSGGGQGSGGAPTPTTTPPPTSP